MRIGIAGSLSHNSPREWAEKMRGLGCGAVNFPVDNSAPRELILEYAAEAKKYELIIAEVGVWNNPLSDDAQIRAEARERCKKQLRLADMVGAKCCVNIAGAKGDVWDGGYADNYSEKTWDEIILSVREFVDEVKPQTACYSLEPMPYMLPDSPETFRELVRRIDRKSFGVHMDVVNMINSPEKYFNNKAFIEKCFEILGSEILSCHVKDIVLEQKLTMHLNEAPVGRGALDLETYAALAHEASEDMPFIIEHLHSDEEYLEALDYTKSRLTKAGIKFR